MSKRKSIAKFKRGRGKTMSKVKIFKSIDKETLKYGEKAKRVKK